MDNRFSEGSRNIVVNNLHGGLNVSFEPVQQVGSIINILLSKLIKEGGCKNDIKRRPPADAIIKIAHNDLSSRKSVVKRYLDYSAEIEKAYDDINSMIPSGKRDLLKSLENIYYQALDNFKIDYFSGEVDVNEVRANSVGIFDFILHSLKERVYTTKGGPEYEEYVDTGVEVVVAHAFIECIVMENPCNDT